MSTSSTPVHSAQQDTRTIGLVGLAHGSSHFFHLMLPPLFPVFQQNFAFNNAELGFLVTVFFVISGIGQAVSGFVVDRIGARPVLFFALTCFALGALSTATAQGYTGLLIGSALAGLGNAPFHPADFTILNKRVSPSRLGHGFAVHGISGNLGWAAAPAFLIGLTELTGSWRVASLSMGLWALFVIAVLWINRDAIDDRAGEPAAQPVVKRPTTASMPAQGEHPMAFLKLPTVWLCFSFFFFSTCALSAIQSFASPAMVEMYGLELKVTAYVVTGYMLFGAAGMVVGGFLVARTERLEKIIGVCLMLSAALLVVVGTAALPGWVALGVAAVAGFGTGLAGPSRDMLIKQAAPAGATGRVYGTVYSGLDLGFAVAAPIFGWLLDRGMPGAIFHGSALMLALGVVSASFVGIGIARQRRAAAG